MNGFHFGLVFIELVLDCVNFFFIQTTVLQSLALLVYLFTFDDLTYQIRTICNNRPQSSGEYILFPFCAFSASFCNSKQNHQIDQCSIHSGRRKWQPTPVFLPRESRGQRSLVGCCPWGHTESDTTEAT